jgi:hypothetical protein
MKNFLHVALILLIIFSISCEKSDDVSVIPISEDIKSLMFKKGSYWIYEADPTKVADCVYVYSTAAGFIDLMGSDGQHYSYEYFLMNLRKPLSDSLSLAYTYCIQQNHLVIGRNPAYPCASGYLLYTSDTSDLCGASPGSVEFLDSLVVGMNTFHKINKCKYPMIPTEDTYTAKDFGVIRKVYYSYIDSTTSISNLVRWKLYR